MIHDNAMITIELHNRPGSVLVLANRDKHPTRVFSRWIEGQEHAGINAREVVNKLTRAWQVIGVHKKKEVVKFFDPPVWGHLDYPGYQFKVVAMDWRDAVSDEDLGRQRWLICANKPLKDLANDWDFYESVVIAKLMRDYGMNIISVPLRSYSPTGERYTDEYVRANRYGCKIVVESVLHRDV